MTYINKIHYLCTLILYIGKLDFIAEILKN